MHNNLVIKDFGLVLLDDELLTVALAFTSNDCTGLEFL
jgi:hypothetical protein